MLTASGHLPVVYLPGASGRASVWGPVASRLARRRAPILVDYPGFGGAPPDASIASLADLGRAVAGGLPPRYDLVALSMGGVVALELARQAAPRVRRLVLVATAGGVDAAALGAVDWRAAYRQHRPDAPRWFVDDQTRLTTELRAVTAPTLLVFGGNDLVAPVAIGELLQHLLPSARLEVIPGATHDLEEEYPDLLASLIEAHLRQG